MFWSLILLSTHIAPGNQNRLKCLLMRFSLKPKCATRFHKAKPTNTKVVSVTFVNDAIATNSTHKTCLNLWKKKSVQTQNCLCFVSVVAMEQITTATLVTSLRKEKFITNNIQGIHCTKGTLEVAMLRTLFIPTWSSCYCPQLRNIAISLDLR